MMYTRQLFQFKTTIIATFALLFALFVTPLATFAETQSISMTAKQWSFSPSSISVTEGDTVNLRISSVDVDHGFSLPEFGVNETLKSGTTTTVSFVADKSGTYTFSCSVYCGEDHSQMSGTLVVQAADEVSSSTSDSTAPSISGVEVVETTTGTATVEWGTSEPAKGQVEYGTSSGVYTAATPVSSDLSETHSALLSGLSAGTTYYYRIKATDAGGNLARSSESSFDAEGTADEEEEDEDKKDEDSDEDSDKDEDEDEDAADKDEEDEDTTDEDEEENTSSEEFFIKSLQTDSGTFDATDSDITATVGEQLIIKGKATPESTVILEFCCATTQYTVVVKESGDWVFQGIPELEAGDDNSIKIYEKGSEEDAETLALTMVAASDDEEEATTDATADDAEKEGGMNKVALVVIIGLILVIGAGIMFVRQMRR